MKEREEKPLLPSSVQPLSGCKKFVLRDEVAIEDFADSSLVLLRDTLELRRIDAGSRRILELLDGRRTAADVAAALVEKDGEAAAFVVKDVAAALQAMEDHRMVRRLVNLRFERSDMMSDVRYLVNPEVSFRQEDEDGGILFNADTDGLEVINPIAVEIWKALAAPRSADEVVAHLCTVCEDAPREEVAKDVGEFLDTMLTKGFIGIVEEDA